MRNQLGQAYANQGMISTARDSYTLVVEALGDENGEPRYSDVRWRYQLGRAYDFLGSLRNMDRERERSGSRRRGRGLRGDPRRSIRRRRGGGMRRDDPERGLSNLDRYAHHEKAQAIFAALVETTTTPEEPVDRVEHHTGAGRPVGRPDTPLVGHVGIEPSQKLGRPPRPDRDHLRRISHGGMMLRHA